MLDIYNQVYISFIGINLIYKWGILRTNICYVKFEDCGGYKMENVLKATKLYIFILSDRIFQSYWRRKGKETNLQFIIY